MSLKMNVGRVFMLASVKMFRIFYLTVLIFMQITLSYGAQPAEERWSDEVTGEVVLVLQENKDYEKLCVNRAKAQAIEQVAGVKVTSETQVKDFKVISDLVNSKSYAWVKKIKDVKWEQEPVPKRPDEPPQTIYRVRLKALVAVDRNRDEGFAVKLNLNRTTFEDGDEMQINVQSGQDAYLTIFNVLEDDKVTVLLPNRFQLDRFARKGQWIRFPDPETSGSARKLKMFRSSDKPSAQEAILVIATKDDIDLLEGDFSEAAFAQRPQQTGLSSTVWEKLLDIPPGKRAAEIKYYEIKGKKR
jgi:hypothetical protein